MLAVALLPEAFVVVVVVVCLTSARERTVPAAACALATFMASGLLMICATIFGGVDTGWTFYTPYSSIFSNSKVMLAAMGVIIAGFSSILTGLTTASASNPNAATEVWPRTLPSMTSA